MTNYLNTEFNWYQNGIKTVRASGLITLRQFINSVISPKTELIQAFNDIAEASRVGNKKLKDELKKEKLFFVTPSITLIDEGIRNYASIDNFTNLAVFEYDNIPYADVLRDYIFEKQPSCIFAFCSPSLSGCKFIFYIDKAKNVDDYKQLYYGIAHDLDKFANLDLSNRNCSLPLFISYDKDAKFREDAIMSTKRGYVKDGFVPFEGEFTPPEEVNEEDELDCIRLITHLINRIVDQGHIQVISASVLCGGITSYYGLDNDKMWSILEDGIRDNYYLSKGISGYLLTAKTMFNKGLTNPTELRRRWENYGNRD